METLTTGSLNPFPDVLFLDLNMPLKNGMECLVEIRSDKTFDKLPIIIFSTSSQKQAVDTAYENGATFYLKKPDSFDKLKVALDRIFKTTSHKASTRRSRQGFFINV